MGNEPLHPVNTSPPMTCMYGRHDMLFHMVYGENREIMYEFILASAQRLYSLTKNQMMDRMMRDMTENKNMESSLQQTRALFFLFLNVDMQLKEYVCDTSDKKLLAMALNIQPQNIGEKKASGMLGANKPPAEKLVNFFTSLSTQIVPTWMQNQSLTQTDLVNVIREEYVIS